jgi:hypothetical protein
LYWYSPFPLNVTLETRLSDLGVSRFVDAVDTLPAGSLLIYVQPHALLERSPVLGTEALLSHALSQGYAAVAAVQAQHRLIVDWRLEALDQDELARWLGGEPFSAAVTARAPTPADPLLVLLLQDLFSNEPELLDHYLDLELQAELAYTTADTDYADRLLQGLDAAQLLEYWRLRKQQQQRVSALEAELRSTTAALAATKAELEESLLQLQQLEEAQSSPPPDPAPTPQSAPTLVLELDDAGWQRVIDAHPLESHDPDEWLRYGAALLHRLEPGSEQAHQQQQAALAFIQARQAGASEQAVRAVQAQVVRRQIQHAVQLLLNTEG